MSKNVIFNDRTRSAHNVLFISALSLWSMGDKKGAPSLWKTITGYAERGWEVYFITGNKIKGELPDLPKGIHFICFDLPFLKALMKIKKIGFFAKALWWIYFQIVSFIKAQQLEYKKNINIVYGYEIFGVPVAKILSKLWGVPVVSRFQGTILRLVWIKEPLWKLRAWEHVTGLKIPTDLVIMANDGTQGDLVLRKLGVDMNRVKFWMNGVDWEQFKSTLKMKNLRNSLNLKAKYTLLTVSRLVNWKRLDRVIRAMPEIVKKFPDLELVIVGDGPDRENLHNLALQLGIQKKVRFEGAVPHGKIHEYYAAADLFLSFYDLSNVGNPLLEAMMAGKCIVTLNNGDTGKFIENNYNGILLEPGDMEKLPNTINELLENEEHRVLLGANARSYAEKNFWTWQERLDAEVNEVLKLVKDI